jgi:hypothetical protein
LIPPPKITVGGTCQAAHEADSRVNATFCTTRLRKEPRAIDADTAALAEAATAVGFRNAEGARSEVRAAEAARRRGRAGTIPDIQEHAGAVRHALRHHLQEVRGGAGGDC